MEMRCALSSVKKNRREAGVTIAMVVLCIAVLFIFAALAVDLGILYTARTSAQHAADAAALAGAYTFVRYGSAPDPAALALAEAQDTVSKATILGKTIDPASVTITVDTANRQVSVSVPRVNANAIETFFAGIMGIKSVAIGATATAQASDSASGTSCLRPFYMPITAGYTVDGSGYCTGQPLFIGNDLTAYGQTMIGAEMDLWSNLVPGQWGLLDLANGGAGIRDTLSTCSSDYGLQAACNAPLPIDTKNGRNVGPVTQGVDTLINTNHANQCPAPGADFVVTQPDPARPGFLKAALDPATGSPCIHAGGTGSNSACIDSSRNVITVAVWNCMAGGEQVSPGKQTITVRGFASVFVQCVNKHGSDNNVQGFLMGVGGCGPGTTTGTGPGAVPVRLVQPAGS